MRILPQYLERAARQVERLVREQIDDIMMCTGIDPLLEMQYRELMKALGEPW